MLVCWVTRLSIRQLASGATPCEVGAQAHESGFRDVKRIVGEFTISSARAVAIKAEIVSNVNRGEAAFLFSVRCPGRFRPALPDNSKRPLNRGRLLLVLKSQYASRTPKRI